LAVPEESKGKDSERDAARTEIEVLILIAGLILTPIFYLWSIAVLNVQELALPIWQEYLTSQLGSDYGFTGAASMYFTPFGLLKALPIDILLWLYDALIILSTIAIVLFGFALIAVERDDVKRVRILVHKGRSFLTAALMLIIFFAIEHMLRFTLFPFRLLLGWYDTWTMFVVAFLATIAIQKLLGKYVAEVLGHKVL
jgi:hypothetical protein